MEKNWTKELSRNDVLMSEAIHQRKFALQMG